MFLRRDSGSRVASAFHWDSRAGLLVGIYMGAIQPFVGRIARGDLHCSAFQISIIAAAPFIGSVFSPVWARLLGKRAKLPWAAWTWGIARGLFLGMLFVTAAWPFVLIVSASAIAMTVATPAYTALMKEIYPDRLRGRLMGFIRVGLQGSALVTALVVGRLLDRMSYRTVFPIGAVAGIASAWAFSRISLPRRLQPAEGPHFGLRDTLKILRDDRGFQWFSLSIFVYGFGNLLAQPVYILFQVDRFHITNTQVANMANIQSIVAIAGYFYWGRLLDRERPLVVVLMNVVLMGMINVVYLSAFRVKHLYFAAVFSGLCLAGIELSYLSALLHFADRSRIAQYQSLHSALTGVRGAIGPFLGPVLITLVGMRGTFAVSLALVWTGAAMMYFGLKGKRLNDPRAPDLFAERQRASVSRPERD